jgi:hypothetical protein
MFFGNEPFGRFGIGLGLLDLVICEVYMVGHRCLWHLRDVISVPFAKV